MKIHKAEQKKFWRKSRNHFWMHKNHINKYLQKLTMGINYLPYLTYMVIRVNREAFNTIKIAREPPLPT